MLLGHFDDNSIPPSDSFYDLHLYASVRRMKMVPPQISHPVNVIFDLLPFYLVLNNNHFSFSGCACNLPQES